MHHQATAGRSPERTFRSISFSSSSEWVMIWYGVSLPLYIPMRDHLWPPPSPRTQSASLFLPFSSPYKLFLLSLWYHSSICLTVPLLSTIIAHRTVFPVESTASLLPWQQCHIVMYLLGWEEMCWFVVAVMLDCMSHSLLRHRSEDMSNVYRFLRLLNEQPQTLCHSGNDSTWLVQ